MSPPWRTDKPVFIPGPQRGALVSVVLKGVPRLSRTLVGLTLNTAMNHSGALLTHTFPRLRWEIRRMRGRERWEQSEDNTSHHLRLHQDGSTSG